jgi:hypothetical protein
LLHIENGTAAWVSGNERWTRGVPACDPSGDNIVAELGSEMTKNGNIVSDSDSSRSRSNRSHLGRMPNLRYGHMVVQEGPSGLNLLTTVALVIPSQCHVFVHSFIHLWF